LRPVDTGGSGLKATHYRLDGSAAQTGTVVTIYPPVSGTVPHTVQYWSDDNVGNVEVAHSINVSVSAMPDTIAPVTTSDATSGYNGTATIHLFPTDVGSGVNVTHYRIDAGAQQNGTTIVIAPPSSGQAAHTIYWWSVDNQNNMEATKSYNITVNAVVSGNATLHFRWESHDWAEAELHVENASGQATASSGWLNGYDSDSVDWNVTVPARQNYKMVCDYYYDEDNDDSGGGYSIWTYQLSPSHNPLQTNDQVVWWY